MHPEAIEDSVETLRPQEDQQSSSFIQHGFLSTIQSSPSLPPSEGRSGFDETASEWSLSSPGGHSPPEESSDSWMTTETAVLKPFENPFDRFGLLSLEPARRSSDFELDSRLQQLPEELLFQIISNLPATDLLRVKLVSRRFYHLVDSPLAWMHAFARFFPGSDSLRATADFGKEDGLRSERRAFTRLGPSISWSAEYLRRTNLLRCLQRGRPALPFAAPIPGKPNRGMATFTFPTRVGAEVSHLHAEWGHILDKRKPQFIHGLDARGTVTCSDRKGKFDSWGLSGHNLFRHFADFYAGYAPWGLGRGDIVGVPNQMDLAQSHGMIYAEGIPGGVTFYLGHDEKSGRILAPLAGEAFPDLHIPKLLPDASTTCCVTMTKTDNIPQLTQGAVGMMTGSSVGIVSAFSLGASARRFARGELTARWILSPGVPIIQIIINNDTSTSNRLWAVALNALGEIFTLAGTPSVPTLIPRGTDEDELRERESRAWSTGLALPWILITATQRKDREADLYDRETPPYYLNHQHLKTWFDKSPAEVQAQFEGWNMRRTIEADFFGSFEHSRAESIFVIDRDHDAAIARFTNCALESKAPEWRMSCFAFGKYKSIEVTATAVDESSLTRCGPEDDAAAYETLSKIRSSGGPSPGDVAFSIPGQRARFMAAGTGTGLVFVWNMRAPVSGGSHLINTVKPCRIIHTDSPSITSLALTALYLVHGGSEGLVQAWDPLASTLAPLRTLSARKAINNRRRLVIAARQNPTFWAGTGTSQFACTKICLDPDVSVLRGIAAIGGYLKYWSYSSVSQPDDESRTRKRKTKRVARGVNQAQAEGFGNTRRTGLRGLVDEEMHMREMERKQMRADEKEDRRIAGRFGLDLLGEDASEEDMLAYAKLLSEEEHSRQQSVSSEGRLRHNASQSEVEAFEASLKDEELERWKFASWRERFDIPSSSGPSPSLPATEDDDLARALHLSLADASSPETAAAGTTEEDDLAAAIKLSLEDSPHPDSGHRGSAIRVTSDEDFPTLNSSSPSASPSWGSAARSKGKGRSRF